ILVGALLAVCAGVFAIDALRGSATDTPPPADNAAPVADAAQDAAAQQAAALAAAATPAADAAATDPAAAEQPVADPAVAEEPGVDVDGCLLDVTSVKQGDTGPNVECLQKALTAAGFYNGPIDGNFSHELTAAATQFQTATGLYVDGI